MGQLHFFARFVGPPLVDVDHQLAELEAAAHGLRRFETRPPEVGVHARHQLTQSERLADVVVGPDLQRNDDVDLVRARAHHDHRHRRIQLAQLPADVEAGAVGQRHLEKDQVRMRLLHLAHRLGAAVGLEHLEAVLLASCPDLAPDRSIRVDDQNLPCGLGHPSILTDLKDC